MSLRGKPGRTSLSNPVSDAATRTRPVQAGPANPRHLALAQVIASPATGLRYRTERLLREGGFGQVYLARRLGRSSLVPATLCIKVSERIDAWHRGPSPGGVVRRRPPPRT